MSSPQSFRSHNRPPRDLRQKRGAFPPRGVQYAAVTEGKAPQQVRASQHWGAARRIGLCVRSRRLLRRVGPSPWRDESPSCGSSNAADDSGIERGLRWSTLGRRAGCAPLARGCAPHARRSALHRCPCPRRRDQRLERGRAQSTPRTQRGRPKGPPLADRRLARRCRWNPLVVRPQSDVRSPRQFQPGYRRARSGRAWPPTRSTQEARIAPEGAR